MLRRICLGVAMVVMVGVVPAFARKAAPPKPEPPKSQPAPEKKENCELTLEDFMKTQIQATIKDKTLTKDQVDAKLTGYFKTLSTLAPDPTWNTGTNNWKKISTTAIDKKSWGTSCKTCHKLFEEKYKKSYKDKKICVPS